jgi:hypothetical protein
MKDKEQILKRRARLREFHAMDRHEQFADGLRRLIGDPLRPKADDGSIRVNPILILLAMTVLLTGATFLFFGFFLL